MAHIKCYCCISIYRAGQRLSSFILLCNLFGIIPFVNGTMLFSVAVFLWPFLPSLCTLLKSLLNNVSLKTLCMVKKTCRLGFGGANWKKTWRRPRHGWRILKWIFKTYIGREWALLEFWPIRLCRDGGDDCCGPWLAVPVPTSSPFNWTGQSRQTSLTAKAMSLS